jgi:hypothetical protein
MIKGRLTSMNVTFRPRPVAVTYAFTAKDAPPEFQPIEHDSITDLTISIRNMPPDALRTKNNLDRWMSNEEVVILTRKEYEQLRCNQIMMTE